MPASASHWCRKRRENLQFSGVALRPLAEPQQRAAELYFVWRDDNDNPLLPVIAAIARSLAGGA